MNAKLLLKHYETIADAPDAIVRLRRFILDLAVRGKLVRQDPNDEPASELLKRLKKTRSDLEAAGKIRSERGVAPSHYGGEQDLELPGTWSWARLTEIGQTQTGTSPSSGAPDLFGDFIPFIKPADLDGNQINYDGPGLSEIGIEHSRLAAPNSILMVCIGATLGKVNTTSRAVCFNQQINSLTPFLDELTAYIALALKASDFQSLAWSKAGTGTLPIISKGKWEVLPIPLPPPAEQHRIVAKVDELMALCDRLETARASREAVRNQLAAASLALLNAPDPETLQADARFVLAALPALTTRPDQIKQVRQTILNLAVRGKLVLQDHKDEPASELLKRIAKQKAALVTAGEIREEKPLPLLSDAETSFELPSGWAWVRLGNLSQFVTSGSRDWAKHYSNDGAIFIRMGNLSRDHYRLRLDHIQRVKPPANGEGTRTRLEAGDILISITGDVGMLGLIPEGFGEAYINQHTAMMRPMPEMKSRYLAELFRSPFAQNQFNEPQRGIKNSFRLTDVTQFVVALPPLAEQHRIVAKVDALMALCDRMEASLATSAATRRRLLDALLAEALAPAEDRELEAAE